MPGNASLGTIRGTIKIDYDGAGVAKANQDVDKLKAKGPTTEQAWNRTSKVMAVGGLAIAAGFAVAIKSASDFEQGLSNIKAVSGATGAQMDQIRAKALQLGKDTKFSAGEAASAMEELAKAGISIPDIMNGAADATVALAAAGGIALPEAATIASNAMNQFGLSAKELPGIADLIAGAANASAIDVSQLGQSMQQAGAVAHLAGLSFKDTATAIALMGNAGIAGSDAGTSLKTFLQNLIPQTKQQINLFKKLGLETKNGGNAFFDAKGKVKSLADISQVLQNSLKGMSKEQKLATLQTLFGSDAIRAAAILSDNGAAGFNKMADAMGKVKAADVAKTKMDNLAGSLEQMKGSLETAGIEIGSAILPPLKQLVDFLTGMVNAFASLSPGAQRFIIIAVGVAGGVLLMMAAIIKIVQFIKAFQVTWAALNASFLFSPIGLIIIAILALVVAFVILWKRSAAFRNFWIGLWNGIWGVLKAIGAWFTGPFVNFFIGVWNWLKAFGLGVARVFVGIWNALVAAFNAVAGPVAAFVGAIVGAFRTLFNGVATVIRFFAPLFSSVFGFIISVVRLWWSVVSAIFTTAFTIWRAIFTAELGFLRAVWNFFWTPISLVVRAVMNQISTAIRVGLEIIRVIWNATWNQVSTAVRIVWLAITTFVRAQWTFLTTIFRVGLNAILSIWRAEWNVLRSVVGVIINAVVSVVRTGINTISAVFNGLRAMVDRVRNFFNQLKAAASGGVGSLLSFVAGIPGRILSALGNVGGILAGVGRAIIQGLINGIESLAGRVAGVVRGIINSIPAAVRNLLGIHSPSRVMMNLGVQTVAGFVKGLDDNAVNASLAITRTITTPSVAAAQVSRDVHVGGVTMNVPAPVTDPNAQAMFFARKLNQALSVRG